MGDHVNTIRARLEFKVNPNAYDPASYDRKTPLHYAAEMGKVEVMKFLIDHHADAEAKARGRWTPIFYAVEANNKDAVHVLLQKRYGVLEEDEHG